MSLQWYPGHMTQARRELAALIPSQDVVIEVLDQGEGPPASDNLFVPFFTTKPGGSGIGLALARQVAEAHEGGVSLLARTDTRGAVATLWLPRPADPPQPP